MAHKYETDNWPFIQAKWYTKVAGQRAVEWIIIHAMQYHEVPNAAEIIAHDFATRPSDSKASAHINVDNNSIVQCVHDNDIAYAAPNANHNGIHIELAGFTEQSPTQWADAYSKAVLDRAADAAAQYCLKYDIPVHHLTNDEIKAHKKGLCGHYQISDVFHNPSNHRDPGPDFPWDSFMKKVLERYVARKG